MEMTLEEVVPVIRALYRNALDMDAMFPDSGDHWWKSQASCCKVLLEMVGAPLLLEVDN